jgi:hypothetical protein
MNERLIVKNFLCLEDIDIEVKDFLIIIGPQAAGKSLCTKLLYFFRIAFNKAARYHEVKWSNESYDIYTELSDKFKVFFPETYWGGQEFSIEYRYREVTIRAVKGKENSELKLELDPKPLINSQEIIRLLEEYYEVANNNPKKSKTILNTVSDKMNKFPSTTDIFIPAGRSFFTLLQRNIFRSLQTSNNVDPFIVEFDSFYGESKQIKYDMPAEAQVLLRSILKGEYVYADDMLRLSDGKEIALEQLSSGQQEALPLALAFAYISSLNFKSIGFTNIYVEEPEAHLFPDAQEQMCRLISFLRYNTYYTVKFAITTHSPYILAAFNNLIKAGNIVRQNPGLKDAVYKVIPESMRIYIENFSAYWLENGKAVSIIDEESHLINADAIDGVSESIMDIFNELLDIEYDGSEAGENV